MLTSLAYIFILGLFLGALCKKAGLPSLVGYICAGIILGPHAASLLDSSILSISAALRQLALVIILTRAGLTLKLEDLKRVGRPAVLMCFVPATMEILGMVLIAPRLLGINYIEAVLMGAVVAAVSPAVIVPRMIHLIEEGWGKKHSIPQLIMAGASVDDVFVIVVFYSFLSLAKGGSVSPIDFLHIPVAILTGIILGAFIGYLVAKAFKTFEVRPVAMVLIDLSISFLFIKLENTIGNTIPISGLLGVMAMNIWILRSAPPMAQTLSGMFNQLWGGAEILLFALVGAAVDLKYAFAAGGGAVALLLLVLVFRMVGVFICLLGTKLTKKERIFCMIGYMPKATVQAAIGSIPLVEGLKCGNAVLTVAVLSILITAPIGAVLIDRNYRKLLER